MKNLFLLLIFSVSLMTTSLVSAQINDSGMHGGMLLTTKKSGILDDVKGSPYLNEKFTAGTVIVDGKTLPVFLRYDVNTETIEIKTDKASADIYVLPLKNDAQYFLEGDTYVYREINHEGKDIRGYFRVHYDGDKVSLLEKPTVTLTDAVKARTGYEKDKPAQIKIEEDLYLVTDKSVKNVKLKEKDFERALPSSSVAEYISQNKLKTVEDFSKMLEWYDNEVE